MKILFLIALVFLYSYRAALEAAERQAGLIP